MLLRFHKYIWYRMYRFDLLGWGDPVISASQAMAAVCGLIITYAATILLWIQVLTGIPVLDDVTLWPKSVLIAIPVVLIILVLIIWAPGGRYKKIIEEFDNLHETTRQKVMRAIFLCLYAAIWILLFMIPISILG